MSRSKKHKLSKKKYAIGILLLALIAAAGIWFFTRPTPSKSGTDTSTQTSKPSDQTGQNTEETEQPPSSAPVTVPSSKYTLMTENEQYKIQRDSKNEKYIITLYAIINNPDQYDMYKDQLREYKQNALDYLKSKNVDITQVKITYEPPEATDL